MAVTVTVNYNEVVFCVDSENLIGSTRNYISGYKYCHMSSFDPQRVPIKPRILFVIYPFTFLADRADARCPSCFTCSVYCWPTVSFNFSHFKSVFNNIILLCNI